MRLHALAALALLSTAACSVAEPVDATAQPPVAPTPVAEAPVPEPAPQPTDDNPQPCPVLVRFGSFAMGIDRPAFEAVEQALRAAPRSPEITERPWGREGERDLCVAARDKGEAQALLNIAREAVPARPLRGPVTILLYGRTVYPAAGG
jgi:hypothetical protein